MILCGPQLKTALKRDIQIAGDYDIEKYHGYIEVTNYRIEKADKPGVFVAKSNFLWNSPHYVAIVQLHPNILRDAEVSGITTLGVGAEANLNFVIRPLHKEYDLEPQDYLCRIYVLDGRIK